MKLFLSLFIFLVCINNCFAQAGRDSLLQQKDTSIRKPVVKKAPVKVDSSGKKILDSTKPRSLPSVKPSTSVVVKRDSSIRRAPDTTKPQITPAVKPDSSVKKATDTAKKAISVKPTPRNVDPASKEPGLYYIILRQHPYFNFFAKPRYEMTIRRPDNGKDGLFYLLTGLVLYFALVRLLFSKYMSNLFAVFFRVSLKQKQIREQLLQSPLPSMLLNIFFIIAGGTYISFLLRYYNFVSATNLWFLILYSVTALAAVYLVKFVILKMLGWMFNITEATDTYVFVIFLVNKLLGILLIPFLILLAFSSVQLTTILVTLSFTMIAILFAYRYIISYAPVRKEIKVSQFHFFLYLCAFEIIPLLLIYKVLLTFLERNS